MTLGGGLSGGGSTISVFGAGVLSKLTDSATTILDEAEAMFKESPLPPPLPPPPPPRLPSLSCFVFELSRSIALVALFTMQDPCQIHRRGNEGVLRRRSIGLATTLCCDHAKRSQT